MISRLFDACLIWQLNMATRQMSFSFISFFYVWKVVDFTGFESSSCSTIEGKGQKPRPTVACPNSIDVIEFHIENGQSSIQLANQLKAEFSDC